MAAATKIYTKLREFTEGEKFGSHVGAIMFALRNGPQSREKVVAVVEKRLEGNTQMVAGRIVSFHIPRMVARGLVEITIQEAEVKPAKKKAKAKST